MKYFESFLKKTKSHINIKKYLSHSVTETQKLEVILIVSFGTLYTDRFCVFHGNGIL